MINVTLTFSGVPELLEFFTSIGAPATAVKVEVAPPAAKPAKKAATPAPVQAEAAAPQPADPPAPAPAATLVPDPAPEAAPQVAYADLQKAVLALYTKDRSKAATIATDMGYASFKVMPADRWADALAKVNAALEG